MSHKIFCRYSLQKRFLEENEILVNCITFVANLKGKAWKNKYVKTGHVLIYLVYYQIFNLFLNQNWQTSFLVLIS